MAIAFVQVAGDGSVNNGGNCQCPLDGTVADGNLLLWCIASGKGTQTSTWTDHAATFGTQMADQAAGANSTDMRGQIWRRLASSDAGVTWQKDHSLTCNTANAALEYSGVDATTPDDGVTPVSDHDVSSLPGLSTNTDGAQIVLQIILQGPGESITTPPAGTGLTFTLRESKATTSGGADAQMFIYDAVQTAHGPTGTISWTASKVTNSTAILLALKPAAGGGGGSASFADSVPLATSLTANEAAARALADSVPLASSAAANEAAARSVADSLPVATSLTGQKVVVRSTTDSLPLSTSPAHTTGTKARGLADSVPLSTSPAHTTATQVRALPDAVPLSTSLFGQKVSPRATADSVPLASSLARVAGVKSRGMADGMSLATSLAVRVHLSTSLADAVGLSTSLAVTGGQVTHPVGSMTGAVGAASSMSGAIGTASQMSGAVGAASTMTGG